ncbi:hypothetical protein [Stenotrophomonas maltophilia]|uniref:hypothetical protein n=1 Tax=Stenotrophomonas maltophilia TaxID=40324 RepID=UPI00021E1229|nr:hypothetical protein [Stenotrophomonas maltophilia]AEM50803.1 hypothetical protein BurJV3_1473 [Stenotrophomonas maltophilia JV3]
MADPYQAGQALGAALFGNSGEAYSRQLQVEKALADARQARSKAVLANQINEQRALVNPDLVSGVLGGDDTARATLGSIALLANDRFDAGQLNDVLGAAARSSARDAALGGNWEGANANLMAVANGPQELGAVQGQNLLQNRFKEGGGGISTTEQGRAGIAADAARAAASYASANSSNASAARTRQGMGIDAAKFGMERSGQWNPSGKAAGTLGDSKPLPVGALKDLLAVEDALGGTAVLNDIIQKNAARLADGTLKISPQNAALSWGRTGLGIATEGDVALNEWKSDLTKIVNESLRLNKGVQTEGDAQRAANELMSANDPRTAAAALARLAKFNRQAVELHTRKQDIINANYGRSSTPGVEPRSFGGTLGDPPAARGPGLPAQGGPAPGTVRNGYRFRGGNPADRNAWEKI